ncbi:MAG: hypothetical protein AAGA17_17210 [Actinomycetota bacterium]
MSVLVLLLVVANVLGVAMIVPQAVRLRRGSSLAGVSVVWIGLSAALNGWWLVYGVAASVWGVVPVSIGGLALYVWMLRGAVSIAGAVAWRSAALGAAMPSTTVAPVVVVGGWATAGLVIGLWYGVQFAPAAWSVIRSVRVDGVSPATWLMAWTEAVIWFVYGLDVGDGALLVGGGGGAVMATVILVRLATVRVAEAPAQPSSRPRRRNADTVSA